MRTSEQKAELFERYLRKELNGEELTQLNNELAVNAALKTELDEYLRLFGTMNKLRERTQLKSRLQNLHEKEVENNFWNKIFRINPSGIAAAAAVALVISISGVFYLSLKDNNKEDRALYTELQRDIAQIKQSQSKLWRELYQKNGLEKNSGTGFAASSDGHIITSYHLIRNAESIVVYNQEYKSLKAKLVAFDAEGDIALLSIEDTTFKGFGMIPYKVAGKGSRLGEKIFTLGYPKEDIVYNEGYISSMTGYNNDSVSYQVSMPVNPGNSGGPLLDANGNLVGMIAGKHKEAEGTAFAVKSDYIQKFYAEKLSDSLQAKIRSSKVRQSFYNRPDQLEKLRKYVVEVRVY